MVPPFGWTMDNNTRLDRHDKINVNESTLPCIATFISVGNRSADSHLIKDIMQVLQCQESIPSGRIE